MNGSSLSQAPPGFISNKREAKLGEAEDRERRRLPALQSSVISILAFISVLVLVFVLEKYDNDYDISDN